MSVARLLNATAFPKNSKVLEVPFILTDLPEPAVSSAVLKVPPVIVAPEVIFPEKFPASAFIVPVIVAEVAVKLPSLSTLNGADVFVACPIHNLYVVSDADNLTTSSEVPSVILPVLCNNIEFLLIEESVNSNPAIEPDLKKAPPSEFIDEDAFANVEGLFKIVDGVLILSTDKSPLTVRFELSHSIYLLFALSPNNNLPSRCKWNADELTSILPSEPLTKVLFWSPSINAGASNFIWEPDKKATSLINPKPVNPNGTFRVPATPLKSPSLAFNSTSYGCEPVLSTISIYGVAWLFGLAFSLIYPVPIFPVEHNTWPGS